VEEEMTTAKEAFEAKKLAQKYGVIGKVAGRYRESGYKVDVLTTDDEADYNFTAVKKGEKLAIKVYHKSGTVPVEVVEKLAGKSKEEGFKPILILYGAGPKLTEQVSAKAGELSVSIRRVRA
jgi:predicted RecB family endonuclease